MAITEETRHEKVLYVSPEAILCVLFYWHERDEIMLPYLIDLPEDIKVKIVDYDAYKACFKIILTSKDFDEVPLFNEPPILNVHNISIKLSKRMQQALKKKIKQIVTASNSFKDYMVK